MSGKPSGTNGAPRLNHGAADDALITAVGRLGCLPPTFDRDHYPDAFAAWSRRAQAVLDHRHSPKLSDMVAKADLWSGQPANRATAPAHEETRA